MGYLPLTVRGHLGEANQARLVVPAGSSVAKFLDELVALPSNFVGKVTISPSYYVIGLRFTGQVFTSIPPTECVWFNSSCSSGEGR